MMLLVGLATILVAVVVKQCFSDNFPFDFAYFHAAGRTWRAGFDPYGPAFAHFALPYIPPESALWAYPPQWWAITVTLASFKIGSAVIIWKSASLLALALGCALLFDALSPGMSRASRIAGLIFCSVLASADAAWITLRIGQTSLFVLLGFALVLHGLRYERAWRIALGLVILLLKPQFGLFFVLLLLGMREGRRPALIALALSLLACLPLLLSFGLAGTIESAFRFFASLSAYDVQPWNRPGSLSGIAFLAAMAGLPSPSPLVTVLLAWGMTEWICRWAEKKHGSIDAVRRCLIGLSGLFTMAPLHGYDLALLPVFLLVRADLKPWAGWLIVLAIVSIWRMGSIAFALYGEQVSVWKPGLFLAALAQAGTGTLAALLTFIALVCGGMLRPKPPAYC